MKLRIIMPFAAVIILAVGHVILYAGLVFSFGAGGSASRSALAIMPPLLTLFFIGSLIISRKFNNFATRFFYSVSASWLGLFLYAFIASALAEIIHVQIVGRVLFGIAAAVFAYGLVQAGTIRTTRYTVSLKNLPQSWKGKSFAFVSDIHLGQVYGSGLVKRMVKKLNSLNPEAVLIGGDLYDGVAVDEVGVIAPLGGIVAPLGTYFVTGNHDGYGNEAAYLRAVRNLDITILDDESVDLEGIQLVGVDFKDSLGAEKYSALMKKIPLDSLKPSILMKHVPNELGIAADAGIALQLSGHTHRAQLFPFSVLTKRVYHGFDYGMKSFKHMQVITSSGIGNWGPPVRVGTRSEIVLITLDEQG